MTIFERYSLHLTSGPSRSHTPTDPEADTAHLLGHAPLPTAPVPPSLVQRLLSPIQIHDRYRLGKAVERNDTHGAERALQDPRCDPNFSHSGQPPIVTAADFDNGQAVEMLLGAGANIDPLPDGWSLLGDAARNRRNNAAKALLSAPGVHAHHIEPDQRNALTIAAEAGDVPLLKVLLERPETRVGALDGRNLSAMDAALRAGQFKAVELLLEFGAEIPAGAAAVRTLLEARTLPHFVYEQALAQAITKGDLACAIVLIKDPRVDLDARIDGDRTLRDVAAAGDPEISRELEPARVFVRRHDADAILAHLREHPAERPALLEALAKVGDLGKLLLLAGVSDLQHDLVKAVEKEVGSSQGPDAAALVRDMLLS